MAKIEELELFVRQGNFRTVQAELKKITLKNIRREEARPLANIARRVDLSFLALSILNPIVRGDVGLLEDPPHPLELIEYAECLRKVGAPQEADRILKQVDNARYPQALLYRALCSFSGWRYQEAIPLLNDFILSTESDSKMQGAVVTPYLRLVGQLNLAAAYVFVSDLERATELLEQIIEIASVENHELIYGNALELLAQVEIRQEKYSHALEVLDRASKLLKKTESIQLLWVEKWIAVAKSLSEGKVLPQLQEIRLRAIQSEHWETVRDCHFYESLITKNPHMMSHLFFGTPHQSYRERIQDVSKGWLNLPNHYLYGTGLKIINLQEAKIEGGESILPEGQLLHRFFNLLVKDFFKPLPVIEAFALLFPEEFVNPQTSFGRVHQAMKRLRKVLLEKKIDIEIIEKNGAYQLKMGNQYSLRVGDVIQNNVIDLREVKMHKIRNYFKDEEFKSRNLQELLQESPTSIKRLLQWAVENNQLHVLGNGPKTRYRMVG